MSTENRYMRIEDWQGNVYYPETSSAGTTAGYVINSADASDDPESSVYTEGKQISDPESNGGKAIVQKSLTELDSVLFRGDLTNISFGDVIVNIRAKVSAIGSGIIPIMKVKLEYINGDDPEYIPYLLSESEIRNTDFKETDVFTNVSVFGQFKLPPDPGPSTTNHILRVTVIAVGGINIFIYFDQCAVSMAIGGNNKDENAIHYVATITNSSITKSDSDTIIEWYSNESLAPESGDFILVKDANGNEASYLYTGTNFILIDKRTLEKLNSLVTELKDSNLAAYKAVATSVDSESPSDDKVPTEKGLVDYFVTMTSDYGTAVSKDAAEGISESSDNTTVPTSRAVYTFVSEKVPTVGTAATKDYEETLVATHTDLPTSKAVAEYVRTQVPTGTAAGKNYTESVTSESEDLPTSEAVVGYITTNITNKYKTAAEKDFTTSLSETGTDDTLPTSKAVITYLGNKYKSAATKNVVSPIVKAGASDNEIPTEKAVVDYINNNIKWVGNDTTKIYTIEFNF